MLKVWTKVYFMTKLQLPNLHQTVINTFHSINISNSNNLNKTSAAKYWPNFSKKISPELQLQTLDQTLCSKSERKSNFRIKLQLPNLHQTVINTFISITISNSNNLDKFLVGIFTCQGHINQDYETTVSQLVSDKGSNDRTQLRWKHPIFRTFVGG